MKNWSAWVLVLGLSSTAYADRVAENLRGFDLQDLCGNMTATVTIDGVNDDLLANGMNQIFKDQDILFGSQFDKQSGCKLFMGIIVQGMSVKNGSGSLIGYAYFYNFFTFPLTAKMIVGSKTFDIAIPDLYGFSSLGVTDTNRNSLASGLNEIAEDVFQKFLLDWRKVH